MIYSFIMEFGDSAEHEVHLLVPEDCGVPKEETVEGDEDADALDGIKGRATLHYYDPHATAYLKKRGVSPHRLFFDGQDNYLRTFSCFVALRDLYERGVAFDVVEFVDFAGPAVATIQAKRAGMLPADMQVAVRLHSTFSQIAAHEPGGHLMTEWVGRMFSLERYALRHADIVVGHLPFAPNANARLYGLGEDWAETVVLESPPILPQPIPGADLDQSEDETVFLFSSRLQRFKRPDLFIKAAVLALDAGVERSRFVLASYGWDDAYVSELKTLVPDRYQDRICFEENLSETERLALIARSVVVIPSTYESLCLFAYEAGLAGRPVILNGRCEAFDETSPWRHDVNCLKFAGTAADLAQAMINGKTWRPKSRINPQTDPPYWRGDFGARRLGAPDYATPPAEPRKLGLIYFVQRLQDLSALNLFEYASISDSAEIVLVCTAQTVPHARALLADKFKIVETSFSELNSDHLLQVAKDYDFAGVGVIDRHLELDTKFYQRAYQILNADRDPAALKVVTSHIIRDGDPSFVYGNDETLSIISQSAAHEHSVFSADYLANYKGNDFWGRDWLRNFTRVQIATRRAHVWVCPQFIRTDRPIVADNPNYVAGAVGMQKANAQGLGFLPLTHVAPYVQPDPNRFPLNALDEGFDDDPFIALYQAPWSLVSEAVIGAPPPPNLGFDCFVIDPERRRVLTHPTEFGPTFARLTNGVPSGVSSITAFVMTSHPEATALDYALSVSKGVQVADGLGHIEKTPTPRGGVNRSYPARIDKEMWTGESGTGWRAVPPMRRTTLTLNLPYVSAEPLTLNFGVRAGKGQSTHLAWAYWHRFIFA